MPEEVLGVPVLHRPGYEFDPYRDESGEVEDGFTFLFVKWTGKGGLFSTWRERHIGIAGIVAGLKAGTLENVPDCPPLWADECQYFNGCAMIANVLKCQWPGIIATVTAGIAALKMTGVI